MKKTKNTQRQAKLAQKRHKHALSRKNKHYTPTSVALHTQHTQLPSASTDAEGDTVFI